MGKIKSGLLGGFSGRVGPVVGGTWKGISYMRSKPDSVANPRTAPQVGQRTKFSTTVALAQLMLVAIIKPLWDRFSQQMSGFNSFVKQNIDAVTTAGVVNWPQVRTSIGSLTGIDDATFNFDSNNKTVTVSWTDNSGSGTALESDVAYIVAIDEEGRETITSTTATRDSESASLVFSEYDGGMSGISVYMALRRADGTLVSNSTYVT